MKRRAWVFLLLLACGLIACQAQTNDADGLLESGKGHLAAGEYEEAIADFEAAVELKRDESEAHFLLGQSYYETGQLDKAKSQFITALTLNPDDASAHHNLGVTYLKQGDVESARSQFEKALEIDPDDPQTHYQLGMVYFLMALPQDGGAGSLDESFVAQADAEFERALELRENMPEALIGLGRVSIARRDYQAAIEYLERAIAQDATFPEAHYALGEAYAYRGEKENACQAYHEFLEMDPPAAWAEQGQQALNALGCP